MGRVIHTHHHITSRERQNRDWVYMMAFLFIILWVVVGFILNFISNNFNIAVWGGLIVSIVLVVLWKARKKIFGRKERFRQSRRRNKGNVRRQRHRNRGRRYRGR